MVIMKKRLNRLQYLQILDRMTPSERVAKAWELTNFAKAAAKQAIRDVFPDKTEAEIHQIFLQRLQKCHNQNY